MMEDSIFSRIRITHLFVLYVIILIVIGALVLTESYYSERSIIEMQEFTEEYADGQNAINDLMNASDYLTEKARAFVVTGDPESAHLYQEEVEVNRRRDRALAVIKGFDVKGGVYSSLENALKESNDLKETEYYAMLLSAVGHGIEKDVYQGFTGGAKLTKEDSALSSREKIKKATSLVFNDQYEDKKNKIRTNVQDSLKELISILRERQLDSYKEATTLVKKNHQLLLLLLFATLFLIMMTIFMVMVPIRKSAKHIEKHEPLQVKGAYEFQMLAKAYDKMLETSQKHQEKLSYEATHDELTGLLNRKMFEEKREELAGQDIAMLIMDIDHFKEINDTYGHEMGDKILKKVGSILSSAFRLEDYVCRIGGDEFAVIMRHMKPDLKGVVRAKISKVQEKLIIRDDLPKATLSIGAAFESDEGPEENIFRKADKALYSVKATGRDGYAFYNEM